MPAAVSLHHSRASRRSSGSNNLANLGEKSFYPPSSGAEDNRGLLEEEAAEMGRASHGRYAPPLLQQRESGWIAFFKRKSILLGLVALLGLLWLAGSSNSIKSSLTSSSTRLEHDANSEAPIEMGGSDKAGEDSNTGFEGLGKQDEVWRPSLPDGAISTDGKEPECRPIPGKPDHQYALMIDAGSTGSRIHIYEFAFCMPPGNQKLTSEPLPTLKNEIFMQLQPGLSSFNGRPKEAAESLRPLMEKALAAVPKSEQHCTPIAVKATAGLRLLGKTQAQDILDEVRRWLGAEYPFPIAQQDGVVIMDGKDEGVYAWITINYLLGLVGPNAKKGETAAVMDLGGASTQIVFEPTFETDDLALSPGDHVYSLTLPSGHHTLYQHSHLGYGLMQARRSVHNLVAFTYIWQAAPKGVALEWDDLTEEMEIPTPCLVKGGTKKITLDPPGRKSVTVTFKGTGAGFDACRRVVDVVMAKDALCEVEPCAFGGVYQPKLMETFGRGQIYALSYFYDRIVPLGLGTNSTDFSIADLRQLTQDVCMGPASALTKLSSNSGWNRFKGNSEALEELGGRPEYCLDLTFMYSLLNLGYELAEERQLRVGKKIDNVELGWCLGASLTLIADASVKCTI